MRKYASVHCRCPFAQRAWLALEELGVPYDHKLADPQNKPKEFTDLYASIVQNTDDSAKVPTIIGVCSEYFSPIHAHAMHSSKLGMHVRDIRLPCRW